MNRQMTSLSRGERLEMHGAIAVAGLQGDADAMHQGGWAGLVVGLLVPVPLLFLSSPWADGNDRGVEDES